MVKLTAETDDEFDYSESEKITPSDHQTGLEIKVTVQQTIPRHTSNGVPMPDIPGVEWISSEEANQFEFDNQEKTENPVTEDFTLVKVGSEEDSFKHTRSQPSGE